MQLIGRPGIRVFVYGEPIDMRAGFSKLHSMVIEKVKLNLFDGNLFVFLGKNPRRVKVLPVGRSSFYRFIHRHGLYLVGESTRRVAPEIIHYPGEALILDWGKLRDVVIEGKRKTLWVFVGVLGFSRYLMVRLVWSNDLPTTVSAIESMLKETGGVPSRITSDNPK